MKGRARFWLMISLMAVFTTGCAAGDGGSTGPSTTDTEAPGTPAGLAATAGGPSVINLTWNASTDNVAVTGYKVFRAGTEIGTSATNTYSDSGLASSTTYTYTVAAYDAANNVSAQSEPASATTLATGGTDTTSPPAETGAIKLPQTGQATGYAAGDDGALRKGVAWPSPRFTANSDATVTDNLTGLAWAPDGNLMTSQSSTFDIDKTPSDGMVTWQSALNYVKKLNQDSYLGHSDWRLPNRWELRSLLNYGVSNTASWLNSQGFTNVRAGNYWTSTSYAPDAKFAWYVDVQRGHVINDRDKTETWFVWPVRAGQGANAAQAGPPKTGQATCSDFRGDAIDCAETGQDGELQKGAAWPDPRFVDNGSGTVTDKLTGLVWTKDAKAPGPEACSPGYSKTWNDALDYAACLNAGNYLGHADWRLPNITELESLVHAGQSNTATWLLNQGFSNVQAYFYWTSTWDYTSASYGTSARRVDMRDGYVFPDYQASSFYVWPVRGGE